MLFGALGIWGAKPRPLRRQRPRTFAAHLPYLKMRHWLCMLPLVALVAAPGRGLCTNASSEPEDREGIEEIVVTADLGSMPGSDVRSIFGFDKTLLETPRSASSVTEEMMGRFIIRDIDELIALAPGSFTQSFFGVAGTLDIRGTTGETYFRGIRRLDNPGNYPTPIAASKRVDIVRGPASPIQGPSKIGGYINFEPKTAQSSGGNDGVSGSVGLASGSWRRLVGTAEISGPARIGDRQLGYHLYAEHEDSDSYYRALTTEQTILQASFDLPLDGVELQFGGMYHDFDGMQNAGWNRLTQALIDDGIYITGSPRPLDRDGDGVISHQEFDVDGDGFTDLNPFAAGLVPGTPGTLVPGPFPGACRIDATPVSGCRPDLLALVDPGVATIDGNQVLIDPDDAQAAEVVTLYFDLIAGGEGGWQWRNQMFFEGYDFIAETAYGFSQLHDSWVFEDKLVIANRFLWDDASLALQISPSVRYTRFEHGDDYTNEYFDRRDLTRAASALDRRRLSTRIDADYTDYFVGDYLDLGFALMTDFDWRGLNLVAGARYDWVDMQSRQPVEKLLFPSSRNFCLDASCAAVAAEDEAEGVSWTLSLSYATPFGLRPYVTASRQATVIAGQGADLSTFNVAAGRAFDASKLLEFGLKGSLFDDLFYFALAVYEQERVDFSAQQIVTNQASKTEGVEFEIRWLVNDRLLVGFGYSQIKVVNLNSLDAGGRFGFIGAEDVPGLSPGAIFGGALAGEIRPRRLDARRAGIPEHIWSVTGTYDFGRGLAANLSIVDVDSTFSGFSKSVRLPAYTLVNAGVVYERGSWVLSAAAKNLTNERYFRANFPNLFGGVVVLPELPRHYAVRIQRNF